MSAADNVIIHFIGDTTELKPVENVLDEIIQKDKEVGAKWEATSKKITTANKDNVQSTSKLANSIEALHTATKNGDKSVIGGAYKDYLKQIQSQLGLTSKELITYVQNARKAAQAEIFNVATQEEADQLTLSIEIMNQQLKELGVVEEVTGSKMQSLKSQLREMRNELGNLDEGSAEFELLKQKAGELDDRIKNLNSTISHTGSDTKNLDGMISLASGIAGGFAAAEGAIALFSDGNEQVQQALLKVNAAMSILQGLQQIGNVIQKESSANLFINSYLRKKAVVETQAQTIVTGELAIAEVAQTAATETATVAQEGLNLAMLNNPVAIIIAAVTGLIAAYTYFSGEEERTAKVVKETNIYLLEQYNFLQQLKELHKDDFNSNIIEAQNKLAIAMVDGSSKTKQMALDISFLTIKYKNAYYEYNKLQEAGNSNSGGDTYLATLQSQLDIAINKLKEFSTKEQSLKQNGGKVDDKFKEDKAGTEESLKLIKQQYENQKKIVEEYHASFRELNVKNAEKERYDFEQNIKSQLASTESIVDVKKLAIVKNEIDTKKSIEAVTNAEIKAIEERVEAEKKLNPNSTDGEKLKQQREANLKIAELKKDLQLKLLDIEKAGINANLLLTAKGSQDEFINKLLLIDKEQQLELAAKELTIEKIKEINNKATIAREQALKERELAKLAADKAILDIEVENAVASTKNELDIKIKAIDLATKTEIENIDKRVAATEEGQKKIAEINNRNKNEKIKIQLEFEIKKIDTKKQIEDAIANAAINAEQRVLDNLKSSYSERKKAEENIYKDKLAGFEREKKGITDKIKLEEDAATEIKNKQLKAIAEKFGIEYQEMELSADEKLAIEEKYQAELTSLEDKETQLRYDKEQKELKRKQATLTALIDGTKKLLQEGFNITMDTSAAKTALLQLTDLADTIFKTLNDKTLTALQQSQAIITATLSAGQQIINQIFADANIARQQNLADTIFALEEQKNKELSVKNITEQQKQDIEKKYKERERQEKIKAFEAEKEAKKEQAIINGALAITNIWAYNAYNPIAAAILTAIAIAATAFQVDKISSAKPPKFKHGKVNIDGPGTSTSDSIHAMISKGESVINADSTSKWKDALVAINNNAFEPWLLSKLNEFVIPKVPDYVQHTTLHSTIDYDKLANTMAAKLAAIIPVPTQIHNNIDGDSLKTYLLNGNSKTEIKNQYFSIN
jgi:hypothetical protein